MNELIRLPYEISLWEDRLTIVDKNGNEYDKFLNADTIEAVAQYYKEKKLCVIGSNTMNSLFQVCEPNLVRKTDGTSTLTFSMYAKVYDIEKEEFVENPFIKYLTNERKVKLKYYPNGQLRWLDFVIKKIEESSENYKFKYTATDLFINELSKTGYNLEFDMEIGNNQGTVQELGDRILYGTDWSVGEDGEIIQQLKEEAVYEISLSGALTAKNIFDENDQISLQANDKIYAFYTSVFGNNDEYYQFIYNKDGIYTTDENGVVHGAKQYYCNKADIRTSTQRYYNGFRAEKYVRAQKSEYDKILERYVNLYSDKQGNKVYGYTESEYFTPSLVTNYITNGSTIISATGWDQQKKGTVPVGLKPSYEEDNTPNINREFGLEFTCEQNNSYLINSGFRDSAESIKQIAVGDQLVFRIKSHEGADFNVWVGTTDRLEDSIFSGEAKLVDSENYKFAILSAKEALSYEDLTSFDESKKINIYIQPVKAGTYHIQKVELFALHQGQTEDGECGIILPDGRVMDSNNKVSEKIAQSFATTKHYYYLPDENATSENLKYLYVGNSSNDAYAPVYDQNFEKIRSITKKETNRFDLLQSLSETFECWCRFDIWHTETGEIMLGRDLKNLLFNGGSAFDKGNVIFLGGTSYSKEDYQIISGTYQDMLDDTGIEEGDFKQLKFVTFHNKIGQKKNIGFRYGTNLKSISRTLDSNNIATKLIVKSNSNEFAEGGSCNIALARENPSGENFVYDFSHYIKQGLMNEDNLINDLYYDDKYSTNPRGWMGLYAKLKPLNLQRDDLITEQSSCAKRYAQNKATVENAKLLISTSTEKLDDQEDKYYDLTKQSYNGSVPSKYIKNTTITTLAYDIERLKTEIEQAQKDLENSEKALQEIEAEIKSLEEQLDHIETQTAELIFKFEQKYSRFIQEASWISEDYIDNNLYYIDAETTLHKSAQPKVSYTINVIELSQLEEYKNYNFDIGDISYIQDTDFFGWDYKNNLKTPHKEEIIITEMSTYFHTPEKCTIKVQNYRTAFESLFQRLTASAQQLQFHSGAYERAADVVDANGNIAPSCLEDAFSNNAFALSNATNQSVKWDESGITTTCSTNPAEIVRITSGGVFLSNNSGGKWTTGITANGINAKTITTGALNTGLVNIYNGSQKSFTWDSYGINAYRPDEDQGYSITSYVRFNHEGISGYDEGKETFSLKDSGLKLTKGTINMNNGSNSVLIDPFGAGNVFEIKHGEKSIMYVAKDGSASFAGDISAATGILHGSLSVADGKFVIDSTQVKFGDFFTVDVNGSVKIQGDLTGSSGKFEGSLSAGSFGVSESGVNFNNVFTVSSDGTVIFGDQTDETKQLKYTADGKLKIPALDVVTISASNITSGSITAANNIKIGNFSIGDKKITAGEMGKDGFIGIYTNFNKGDGNESMDGSANNATTIAGHQDKSWRLVVGPNFGVNNKGEVYATGANISGTLTAGAGSKIGPLTIGSQSIGVSDITSTSAKTSIFSDRIETSRVVGDSYGADAVDIKTNQLLYFNGATYDTNDGTYTAISIGGGGIIAYDTTTKTVRKTITWKQLFNLF